MDYIMVIVRTRDVPVFPCRPMADLAWEEAMTDVVSRTDPSMLARMYHEIMAGFVRKGRAPHYVELAHALGLSPEEARRALHELMGMAGAAWLAPDTDYIASFAPFSNLPTQYLVTVEGQQRWYGQCGFESLALTWVFPGQEVRIDAPCLDCGEPVSLSMKDGRLLSVEPSSMVGYTVVPAARWAENWGYT